jgi:hypothetical protein
MPTTDSAIKVNVVGYSLKHFAIVQVASKSKKGTKKAMSAAMDEVEKKNPDRIILGAQYIKSGGMGTGDTPCETWAVEYIRPSCPSDALGTQG